MRRVISLLRSSDRVIILNKYILTISVLFQVFKNCLLRVQKDSDFLGDVDTEKLFSNIAEVYETNKNFWENHLRPVTEEARVTKKPIRPSQLNVSFASVRSISYQVLPHLTRVFQGWNLIFYDLGNWPSRMFSWGLIDRGASGEHLKPLTIRVFPSGDIQLLKCFSLPRNIYLRKTLPRSERGRNRMDRQNDIPLHLSCWFLYWLKDLEKWFYFDISVWGVVQSLYKILHGRSNLCQIPQATQAGRWSVPGISRGNYTFFLCQSWYSGM